MTVKDALDSFDATPLGYVRMIDYVQAGGEARERTLDTFDSQELLDCMPNDCLAFYYIGQYKYIVYKREE